VLQLKDVYNHEEVRKEFEAKKVTHRSMVKRRENELKKSLEGAMLVL